MHSQRRAGEGGFTLIEALVALAIVSTVVITYIGIRTTALIDATEARNWRLAREIADEKMSELQAGARETPPESGEKVPIEKYEGFAYEIAIGEGEVADLEAEIANSGIEDDSAGSERFEWQRNRESYRRASSQGLSAMEYEDKLAQEDYRTRMEEKAPSETDFEEVAVVVYFPKMNAKFEDEKDSLILKARISTLALSGLTTAQAETLASSRGQGVTAPVDGAGGIGGAGAADTGGK